MEFLVVLAVLAVVVVFVSFDCPVSTSYSPVLAQMAKEYESKGVAFLAVNSSDDGDAAHLAKLAADYKLPFSVLKDKGRAAADAFKAVTVSEVFVLDHNAVLRYRGRIDDGFTKRLVKAARVTHADLKDALDDLLAHVPPHEAACAYVRGRSVVDHARAHAGQAVLLKFDLQDFFATVRASRVHACFVELGYPRPVARQLMALCTTATPGRSASAAW